MKLTLFFVSLSVIIVSSCQKNLEDGMLNGEPIQSNLTMSERVYAFKNTGKYSDTSSIARSGYGIVMHGNSIVERMLYYSWKTSWVDKGYPILNRGIGGTTWNEKIPYIKDLVTVYRPNDIVLYDGENEFLRAARGDLSVATKLLTSFNRAMDSIRRQNPLARVYVVSMITCPVLYKKGYASEITRVNDGYKSRVAKDAILYPGKVKFVDVRPLYPHSAGYKFESDSIHVKLAAYPDFYNALKTALPKPGTGAWTAPVVQPVPVDTVPSADTTTQPPIDTTSKPPADTVVVAPPPPPPITSGNKAPIANAGADITIPKSWNYNPWVYGTYSKDPDGWIAKFKWTCVSGSPYTIVTPDAGKTRLDNLAIGVYVFRVTVTDNKGAQAYDDVKVTITR
jgi:hypothetical protein